MKKILLPVALAAVLTLGACSGKGSSAAADSVADFKSKIENCANSDSLQAYVGQAKDYIAKLVDEGKVEEAKKYLAELEPVVKEKAPQFAAAFETVKSVVDKVPAGAKDSLDKAADAASAAGDSIASVASEVKDAAAEKIGDVKDAVGEKATEVKNAVGDKAADLKDAAKEKVNDILK